MLTRTQSPSAARQNFFSLLDEVVSDCSVVIIERRDAPNVAMLPEDELRSMQECLYLMRSPANARRLVDAMEWADQNAADEPTKTVAELRAEIEQEIKG